MDNMISPGRYVIAVSGGIDSMVLLHMLRSVERVELVVAHYDHGIRDDSSSDRVFVEVTAKAYGLPFVSEAGELGAGASEATARMARYNFLERVRHNDQAIAIITAHHQDDLLETAILNLLRGTGRKGLSSLVSRPGLLRPLLQTSKEEISSYAQEHHVVWHEDSTNTNDQYTRNYIRHQLLPRFDAYSRRRLLDILASSRTVNAELDNQLGKILQMQPDRDVLDRQFFVSLPHAVAKELLATWLRVHDLSQFDAITLERVTIAAKIQHSGAIIDVVQGAVIRISETKLALRHHER